MEIRVMNAVAAKEFSKEVKSPTAIISIRSFGDKKNSFAKNPFVKDILFLEFNDVATNKFGDGMKEEDAAQVRNFVIKVQNQIDLLIVHCDAGISRSAGVAAAIGKALYNDDTFIFGRPKYCPNMRCYRLTLNAFCAENEEDTKEKEALNAEVFGHAVFYAESEEEFDSLLFKTVDDFENWIRERRKKICK